MKREINKILLAEDDSFMRDIISLVLKSEGFVATGAENAQEALQKMAAEEFQAVISDMYLPDLDGFALLEKIRTLQPETLFIMLSGETDAAVLDKAAKLGITYIIKDENFAEAILEALR